MRMPSVLYILIQFHPHPHNGRTPRILAQRFDPKIPILGLFVLEDCGLIHTHKDQFGQKFAVSVRIPDVTYLPTIVRLGSTTDPMLSYRPRRGDTDSQFKNL